MSTGRNMKYADRILRVLVHIHEHLDEELSVEMLAESACYSPTHFHRIFKGMVNETLGEHIRRLRLERAAHRLAYAAASVTDIALDAGYETPESFSRAFKERFGVPPSLFRKTRKPVVTPADSKVVPYSHNHPRAIKLPNQGDMAMDVKITKLPPMKIAFVRHTGPYAECKPAWEKLCNWAGPLGLLRDETLFLGLSYDDPSITPPDKIRYDAALTFEGDIDPQGEIGIRELPGGEYAEYTHHGPYEKLEESYAALMGKWLPQSGREVSKDMPGIEIYRNDPDRTPPEELVTDICIALI